MALLGTSITVIVIGFIILLGLTIYIIILSVQIKKKQKIETTTDVINLLSEWTHGHYKGWLVNQRKTPSGLTRIEYFPTDLSKKERKQEKIENEVVIAKNIKVIPLGNLSSNINILWIFPNTVNETIKRLPYLKLKLNLFKPKKDLEIKINKIFKEELPELIKSLKEKRNGKIGNLETYEEQGNKLTILEKKIEDFKSLIESIKNKFTEISSKDLFDYMVIFEQLKFELGNAFKSSHETSMEAMNSYNFNAQSELDKKKVEENYKEILNYYIKKEKDEKKST